MAGNASNASTIIASLHIMGWGDGEIGEVVGMSRERVKDMVRSEEGANAILAMKAETQKQIFDPVQRKLEEYSLQAADELWAMRLEVENEAVKANILKEILHMAGYRPHTNTDKKTDDLPTIVIGQMNIGTPGESNLPLEVPSTYTEVSNGAQEIPDPRRADDEIGDSLELLPTGEEENVPGDNSGFGWPYREIQRGEGGAGEECAGNQGSQSPSNSNGTSSGE